MTTEARGHQLRTVLDEQTIRGAVERVAREIVHDLPTNIEVIVLGILEGAKPFADDLTYNLRGVGVARGLTVVQDWMKASSYHGGVSSSGSVEILRMPERDLQGRHVVVVDDIIDQGHTLQKIVASLQCMQPAVLRVCVLLDKPASVGRVVRPDYTGLVAPNAFIVGYGLDYQENYRNLPYLASLSFDANEAEELGLAENRGSDL